jgi:tRNA-dihydrouridine synthase A
MRDAATLPVTVKHRIGIDRHESYAFVRDFVGTVATAGCDVFIVHARNAWLKGLSPKENREVPPLRHGLVYRLKIDFPALTIVVNGGIDGDDQITRHLEHVDGVMLGRGPYHRPWTMATWDGRFYGEAAAPPEREAVERAMVDYMERRAAEGVPWPSVARHMMGLWHGVAGARRWRQVWSDHRLKDRPPADVHRIAAAALAPALADAAL